MLSCEYVDNIHVSVKEYDNTNSGHGATVTCIHKIIARDHACSSKNQVTYQYIRMLELKRYFSGSKAGPVIVTWLDINGWLTCPSR